MDRWRLEHLESRGFEQYLADRRSPAYRRRPLVDDGRLRIRGIGQWLSVGVLGLRLLLEFDLQLPVLLFLWNLWLQLHLFAGSLGLRLLFERNLQLPVFLFKWDVRQQWQHGRGGLWRYGLWWRHPHLHHGHAGLCLLLEWRLYVRTSMQLWHLFVPLPHGRRHLGRIQRLPGGSMGLPVFYIGHVRFPVYLHCRLLHRHSDYRRCA
jgi:hypothetical protein